MTGPPPHWRNVTLAPVPVRWWQRRKVRAAFWTVLLGSALSGALGVTFAVAGGDPISPWLTVFYVWYALVWVVIGALGSEDARRP